MLMPFSDDDWRFFISREKMIDMNNKETAAAKKKLLLLARVVAFLVLTKARRERESG